VGVDYKEYLLREDQAVCMAFIDWIAAITGQKGRSGLGCSIPIRLTPISITSSRSIVDYSGTVKSEHIF
jgi:hypothetical protein